MTKSKKLEFRPDEYVVYPAHGVGQIISIEEQEVAGLTLELFVISFEKDKMTLRVPTNKATEIGMRSLSSPRINALPLPLRGWHWPHRERCLWNLPRPGRRWSSPTTWRR